MSVNGQSSQSIHKMRAMVMARVHHSLKHWPDWLRDLGGLSATGMWTAGAGMRLMHSAPNDLAFGYAFGIYTVRTSLNLLSEHDLGTSDFHLQVLTSLDARNADLATKHPEFADLGEPVFGPDDFTDYAVWYHQAPNDFACGTVCGHFSAYDDAARTGRNVAPVVRPLAPR